MNLHVTSPPSFYVRHLPSGKMRKVCAIRITAEGYMLLQFVQVIKHEGQTIYWGDREDCR